MLEEMFKILTEELGFAALKNPNDINNLDTKAKGRAFLKFYLDKIFKHYYRIDSDIIEQGMIDNAGDKGIDFIAIDEEKIYIIQTKYGTKDVKQLEDFINLPQNLKTDLYKNTANAELRAFIKDIQHIKNPEYNLLYVTTERVVEDEQKHYEDKAKSNNVQFSIIDFSKLRIEYETVKTMGDNPPDTVIFNLGQEDYMRLSIEPNETIVVTQKGSKIRSLYQKPECRERLFNLNIRQWLGKNSVNRGMIETIENEPNKFFYYNNGITAICENYILDEKTNTLTCHKFQVVNGAQTLTTIAKQPDSIDITQIKVLIKIVKADKYTSGDRESSLAANIVKNNNSQNVIKSIDFRSNDFIQVSIENKVKDYKLKYPLDYPVSQQVAYKRKRRLNESKVKTISMENIAKTYYSMFVNPYDIYLNSRKLWDISPTGFYYKVFGMNEEKIDSITDQEFYKLFASYYIFNYIDKNIKGVIKTTPKEDYIPYYFKYHILWGVNKLMSIKYSEDQLSRIFKQMVDKGYYLNEKVHQNKEKSFNSYFEKVERFVISEVRRIKNQQQAGDVAMRSLITSKEFLNNLAIRIEEILPSELNTLLADESQALMV